MDLVLKEGPPAPGVQYIFVLSPNSQLPIELTFLISDYYSITEIAGTSKKKVKARNWQYSSNFTQRIIL